MYVQNSCETISSIDAPGRLNIVDNLRNCYGSICVNHHPDRRVSRNDGLQSLLCDHYLHTSGLARPQLSSSEAWIFKIFITQNTYFNILFAGLFWREDFQICSKIFKFCYPSPPSPAIVNLKIFHVWSEHWVLIRDGGGQSQRSMEKISTGDGFHTSMEDIQIQFKYECGLSNIEYCRPRLYWGSLPLSRLKSFNQRRFMRNLSNNSPWY